jgi:phage portal protein BeeE
MEKPGFLTRIKAALTSFRHPSSGSHSHWEGGFFSLPGSSYDYERAAGDLWANSIVAASCKWAARTFPEASFRVERRRGAGWEADDSHDLPKLVDRPNMHYSGRTLWAATLLSMMVDGNAYWLKVRSMSGNVVELWYLPHFLVEPRWPRDGSEFISVYEYKSGGSGGSQWLDPADVVHFRDGLDPNNTRKGLSPLAAQIREVCVDNEAATFSAAILRNSGIVGATITPTDSDFDMTDERAKKNQTALQRKLYR